MEQVSRGTVGGVNDRERRRRCTHFLLHSMCCAACRSKQPTDRRTVDEEEAALIAVWRHLLWVDAVEKERRKRRKKTQWHQFSSATWCGASRWDETLWKHSNHFPRSTQTQLHFHSNRNIQLHCGLWHVNSHDSHQQHKQHLLLELCSWCQDHWGV